MELGLGVVNLRTTFPRGDSLVGINARNSLVGQSVFNLKVLDPFS